jgi:hypothetical protein
VTEYRILVTGSCKFTSYRMVSTAMLEAVADAPPGAEIVIVTGNATGADTLAQRVAIHMLWRRETHQARWNWYGKRAGPVNNQEMVDAGAAVCLAFFREGASNRGTTDCAECADEAGIPVRRYTAA